MRLDTSGAKGVTDSEGGDLLMDWSWESIVGSETVRFLFLHPRPDGLVVTVRLHGSCKGNNPPWFLPQLVLEGAGPQGSPVYSRLLAFMGLIPSKKELKLMPLLGEDRTQQKSTYKGIVQAWRTRAQD